MLVFFSLPYKMLLNCDKTYTTIICFKSPSEWYISTTKFVIGNENNTNKNNDNGNNIRKKWEILSMWLKPIFTYENIFFIKNFDAWITVSLKILIKTGASSLKPADHSEDMNIFFININYLYHFFAFFDISLLQIN